MNTTAKQTTAHRVLETSNTYSKKVRRQKKMITTMRIEDQGRFVESAYRQQHTYKFTTAEGIKLH